MKARAIETGPGGRRQARLRRASGAAAAGLLLAGIPGWAMAPAEELPVLSAKELHETGRLEVPLDWKFHPGDEESFAAPGFDDSGWFEADPRLLSGERPAEWDGLGWFRLRLRVGPGLRGVPLGLLVHGFGAAEVYLDGEPLLAVGTVGPSPGEAVPEIHRRPHLFAFDDRAVHVFAVRFSNHEGGAYEAVGRFAGFVLTLDEGNQRLAVYGRDLRTLSAYQAFFLGVFGAFALLHLLLFAFYREARENLYFALLAGIVALLAYLFLESHLTTDPRFFQLYLRGMNAGWPLLSVAALRFVYSVFYPRPPRQLYPALAAALLLMVVGWFLPLAVRPWIVVFLLLSSVEMVRTVVVALVRRKAGAGILGLGILTLAAGISFGLLASLGIVPPSVVTSFLIPSCSVLFLMLTMSVYLSRRFARTNRELHAQLQQVRELSQEMLEQERRAREEELERRLLEERYQHKVEELEEARQLQLSMLPERLPELPDLEIAAGMYTATEVGGDYYDFDVADDGTLTVAIGDATGHGMKAGALVTATKSLFHALGDEADLPRTLGRFGRALKRMNLRQLRMALMLARFKAGRLRLAAAGMPPALVYRAASGNVEAVGTEGLPLGSFAGLPYQQRELLLRPGDTVLLMSDGFPERLNGDDEMLGYDQVSTAFSRVAATSPRAIIEGLVADGDAWAEGQPAVDDMTFVVLKMRPAGGQAPAGTV